MRKLCFIFASLVMGWYIQALPAFSYSPHLFFSGCANSDLLAQATEAQVSLMRLAAVVPILLYLAFLVAMIAWRQERRKLIKGNQWGGIEWETSNKCS
jgi:Na+/melibiose symporter-like transporter